MQTVSDHTQNDQQGPGTFRYDDNGFTLEGFPHYKWSNITTILGFKLDLMTTDEICMDIFFNNDSVLRLTESIAGWTQFNERLREQFPTIPDNWDGEIMFPAFATNMTLLFDKLNRTKEQAVANCYPEQHGR